MREHPELEQLIALQERLLASVNDAQSDPEKIRQLGAELAEAGNAVRKLLADGLPEGAAESFSQARQLSARLVEATRLESTRVEHSLERVRKVSREVRRLTSSPAQGDSCDIAG